MDWTPVRFGAVAHRIPWTATGQVGGHARAIDGETLIASDRVPLELREGAAVMLLGAEVIETFDPARECGLVEVAGVPHLDVGPFLVRLTA